MIQIFFLRKRKNVRRLRLKLKVLPVNELLVNILVEFGNFNI